LTTSNYDAKAGPFRRFVWFLTANHHESRAFRPDGAGSPRGPGPIPRRLPAPRKPLARGGQPSRARRNCGRA